MWYLRSPAVSWLIDGTPSEPEHFIFIHYNYIGWALKDLKIQRANIIPNEK